MPVPAYHRVIRHINLRVTRTLFMISTNDRTERADHTVAASELIEMRQEVAMIEHFVIRIRTVRDEEGDTFISGEVFCQEAVEKPVE